MADTYLKDIDYTDKMCMNYELEVIVSEVKTSLLLLLLSMTLLMFNY